MLRNFREQKSSRKGSKNMKIHQKTSQHRHIEPPYYSLIKVQGVGFEPTNL